MSRQTRGAVFLFFGAGLLLVLLWGLRGLPAWGHYPGPYGNVLNRVAPSERHVTNVVTSINFDYRGLDTLGEEFILFTALTGLAVLLRGMHGETENEPREAARGRRIMPRSDAVRWIGLGFTGVTNLFGSYIVLHGPLTPGGGFQGGAILGTAALLAYLATGYAAFQRFSPKLVTEIGDAFGAGMYAVIGLVALMMGGLFLQNTFPLGKTGSLASSGTIAAINLFVGVEVSAGFVLLFSEFLKETRQKEARPEEQEQQRHERPPREQKSG